MHAKGGHNRASRAKNLHTPGLNIWRRPRAEGGICVKVGQRKWVHMQAYKHPPNPLVSPTLKKKPSGKLTLSHHRDTRRSKNEDEIREQGSKLMIIIVPSRSPTAPWV